MHIIRYNEYEQVCMYYAYTDMLGLPLSLSLYASVYVKLHMGHMHTC